MFSCITELNYMRTTWQSAGLGRNSDIEYISIRLRANHGIMPVNFRADRFKRTRLHPLRTDGLNPQSPMKPTIKETVVVDNSKEFLDVHGAIPIDCDLAFKGQDSISSLCSGDSGAEEHAAGQEFRDER